MEDPTPIVRRSRRRYATSITIRIPRDVAEAINEILEWDTDTTASEVLRRLLTVGLAQERKERKRRKASPR
jgi:Arc/MetJ-type ribon-helix-helix transcriptional regulator